MGIDHHGFGDRTRLKCGIDSMTVGGVQHDVGLHELLETGCFNDHRITTYGKEGRHVLPRGICLRRTDNLISARIRYRDSRVDDGCTAGVGDGTTNLASNFLSCHGPAESCKKAYDKQCGK